MEFPMRTLFAAVLLCALPALPQADLRRLQSVYEAPLIAPEVVQYQLQRYLHARVPQLPKPTTAADWTRESQRLRRDILDNIVFHGWPKQWVDAPLKVEDLGLIPNTGPGYRIRKLRYEIVPGMYGAALLYEPANPAPKAPGIVNVNGHVGPPGKAVEYKQKRCINQALQGIYSLNLEWFSFGELNQPGNVHWNGAHLDVAGANGVGIFYLAMRKGLDYLAQHPRVDPKRLGVTGLSGGGWQTIILSALDERVAASAPVAGYSALTARLERPGDIGDIEQNPTDMLVGRDYSHLTAMRAPRPTLLMYNAEDNCCFRAPLVKPEIYDRVKPFFALYGAAERFSWHENADPGDHNYQLDNRRHSYAFFTREFGLTPVDNETPVAGQIKSPEELQVGLPQTNLTILDLARQLAGTRFPEQATSAKLREILRYKPVEIDHAWAAASTKSKEIETRSYRFDFGDGLSATAVWAKSIAAPDQSPATILLDDSGRRRSAEPGVERLNRGERVLAASLLFTGDMMPKPVSPTGFAQMLATVGNRPLGLQTAHLIALAHWLGGPVRLQARGPRNGVVALAAGALEPRLFSSIFTEDSLDSLRDLIDKPVDYSAAPELFCLDLYRYFDLADLRRLAAQH